MFPSTPNVIYGEGYGIPMIPEHIWNSLSNDRKAQIAKLITDAIEFKLTSILQCDFHIPPDYMNSHKS